MLGSRRFYADPALAKHVEDASRSYSKAGLNFAQVLDGARQGKGLGTHWMQLQRQSQGRGYVDEQVGRLHSTLQAYMRGQATRPQLNAAVAQFKSNIDSRRLGPVVPGRLTQGCVGIGRVDSLNTDVGVDGRPGRLFGGAVHERVQDATQRRRVIQPTQGNDDARDEIVAGVTAADRHGSSDFNRRPVEVGPARARIALQEGQQLG